MTIRAARATASQHEVDRGAVEYQLALESAISERDALTSELIEKGDRLHALHAAICALEHHLGGTRWSLDKPECKYTRDFVYRLARWRRLKPKPKGE